MTFFRLIAALALAAAVCGAAQAQMPGGGIGGGMGGSHEGMHPSRNRDEAPAIPKGPTDPAEIARLRLDEFFDDLQLRDNQMPAWQAWMEPAKRVIEDQKREAQRAQTASIRPPEAPVGMDQRIDVLRNRVTALEDVLAGGRVLYAVLDDRQKSIANQRMPALIGVLSVTPGDLKRP